MAQWQKTGDLSTDGAPCPLFENVVVLGSMENVFTDANFEAEVLKSPAPVLVDFWAPWCGPCRVMSPIIDEIGEEIDPAKLKVGKCNVDENGNTAQMYGIMSIPTFLVFKGGQVVEQLVGSMDKGALKERVMKHVS